MKRALGECQNHKVGKSCDSCDSCDWPNWPPELLANYRRTRQPTAANLTPDQLERYEERAAVREYDGCQTREEAEAGALAETLVAHNLVTSRDEVPSEPATFERWTQAQEAAARPMFWGDGPPPANDPEPSVARKRVIACTGVRSAEAAA